VLSRTVTVQNTSVTEEVECFLAMICVILYLKILKARLRTFPVAFYYIKEKHSEITGPLQVGIIFILE
jgi:hypothetical protein